MQKWELRRIERARSKTEGRRSKKQRESEQGTRELRDKTPLSPRLSLFKQFYFPKNYSMDWDWQKGALLSHYINKSGILSRKQKQSTAFMQSFEIDPAKT